MKVSEDNFSSCFSLGPDVPTGMGRAYVERACVPYGNSFVIIGGDESGQSNVDTVALFDSDSETFVVLDERLSERKDDVAAFAVSEDMFPPCQ